jgi:hypothetical protein
MEDRWQIAYRDETAIYDTLSRAEDAGDRVPLRLIELCDFAGREVRWRLGRERVATRGAGSAQRRWRALEPRLPCWRAALGVRNLTPSLGAS